MRAAPIEYLGIRSVQDPLLVVEDTTGIGWDEQAVVRLATGETRRGVVLEVDQGLAVVQVFEGTGAIALGSTSVAFTGEPLAVPVGEEWLGRVANGRGEPVDGGPPVFGEDRLSIVGSPINPASRTTPRDPIVTGVSAVDGLDTLVRGQKLPIFSVGGLPHLQLAVQIASQAHTGTEGFRVVFAAMGITNADAIAVRDGLEDRARAGELVLFLNTAADPVIERIVTPRIALTVAEHLAYDAGFHVLVVMIDMTNYAEAVREVASARGEIPTRRGFPGYLYSDLASLYERCGRLDGRTGSVTLLPVLTMPAGDITHPVPDLTGYITEGQLVLSPDLASRDVYPPFDALGSLSRLMRRGAGPDRTRADHLDIAAQLLAALDQARQVRELSELLGQEALSETDRLYLEYARRFEMDFLSQGDQEERTLDETLDLGWRALSVLPRRELTMVSEDQLNLHYVKEPER
jgi:V/A-type H+-transporting ATPase subunit B